MYTQTSALFLLPLQTLWKATLDNLMFTVNLKAGRGSTLIVNFQLSCFFNQFYPSLPMQRNWQSCCLPLMAYLSSNYFLL